MLSSVAALTNLAYASKIWRRRVARTSGESRQITYESGGVVVSDCLGVAVGLEGRVGLDDLLLQGTRVLALGGLGLGCVRVGAVQGVILKDL